MKILAIIFAIFSLNIAEAFSLKDKLIKGSPGDYVVTVHAKIYTVLILRSVGEETLILEEVGATEEVLQQKDFSWFSWVAAGAPGCISWTSYEIELKTNRLLECYSHAQKTWLYAEDPNQFLPKLLSLGLKMTPPDERRRIGPPPMDEETDVRGIWLPPVIQNGKSISKPQVNAWQGQWPNDDSLLSGCAVEFYIGAFPFPYWIDIKSPHYTAVIRAVDSGKGLQSPMPPMPRRPPEFTGKAVWKGQEIELSLKWPASYCGLNLYVLDLTDSGAPIHVPCQVSREDKTALLKVHQGTLQPVLQKGHKYQWLVVPEESNGVVTESEDIFIW